MSLTDNPPAADEWQSTLARIAEHQDRQAFQRLFRHFAPLIRSFALANPYSHNPGQFADDLVQEVMIKIWNKAGSYDASMAGASTWIFTIARNCRIDMIRKHSRHDYPLESDELFDIEDDNSPAPFQAVQQRQFERQLRDCFKELPSDQAQIIAKVYMEGKSHSEVADELGLPLGTVKSRVRLALNKLKVMVTH
ncbi:MAG TPA: sigma-70 family RNA polymerase sigma factor [Pseudomonadales bacterium]